MENNNNKNNLKALNMLGICKKSGNLSSGEFSCETALREGTAQLIIIASDASDNTQKKFINKSFYYKVPSLIFSDVDELSNAAGKRNRAVFAVTDENLASNVKKLITGE